VNVWPAIETVPLREAVAAETVYLIEPAPVPDPGGAIVSVPVLATPAFAATLYVTAPLPVPEAPVATVNHCASLVAVHVQVARFAVTLTT
jgi:hypothetical protein